MTIPKYLVNRWAPQAACVAIALVLCACVANQPYRLGGIAAENEAEGQKPFFEEVPISADQNYRVSFVEFDEKGDFWDRRQLGRTARLLSGSPKPVLLVMFIHGWHHNAADRKEGGKNPGDVETFRCLLTQLASNPSTKSLQVHGVYLGWRGRLIQGPLDYLTFLSRKSAATRVAGTPVTETIFELIRQARRQESGRSKCVLIGHSFGALVLEKAMAQAMTGSMLSQDVETPGRTFNAPADMILLVNSAAESIYAKELSDMLVRTKHRHQVNPHQPLLISITSTTDDATGGWFPRGTFLPNLFAHRRYNWGRRYNRLSDDVDQHDYVTRTPGHNELLFTHRVVPVTDNASLPTARPPICAEDNPAFDENLQRPRGALFATSDPSHPGTLAWWRIEESGPNTLSPYWVMQVPPQIIDKHSPIFTAAGQAMMAALFRITNPINQVGPRRMSISATPE
jgi:hypothetical protein